MSANWEKLAVEHCPIVYEHRLEKFHMTSLDEWFNKTEPAWNEDRQSWYRKYKGDFIKDKVLFNNRAPIYCMMRNPPKLEDVTLDKNILPAMDVNEGDFDVFYFLWFDYNGPKRIVGVQPIEHHIADLETFMIRFDKNGKVIKYFLSMHGDFNIFWPSELEYENNRPVIYTAINSHALFRQVGTFIRFFGFGNDTTDKTQKKRIDPIVNILKPGNRLRDWQIYLEDYKQGQKGEYGIDGVGNIYGDVMRKTYNSIEEPLVLPNTLVNIVFVLLWCLIPFLIVLGLSSDLVMNFLKKKINPLYNILTSTNDKLRVFLALFIFCVYFIKLLIFIIIKIKKFAVIPNENVIDWLTPIRFY